MIRTLGTADQPAVAGVHPAFIQANLGTVFDLFENLRSGLVDQRDTVGDQHLWTEVRIAARDRRRCVYHGGDLRFHQCIGGDAVQIQDVENHNVAGTDPTQQSVDIPVDPGDADQARPGGVTGQKR
ncbi:Uncharacterised protein [Mycobacterium tuberculosis]|uniref:Uncharacterized protein n=1 Tax=Mycobacterium tuberculosis TaxID=1773 RepID=A0A655E957_MYCTX|nr:Uncharacterised protein [Mycobacterium tuberculosis]CFS30285.1 Uncharacterised protein [Mycobacterium tuberculosis]CNV08747.1 Uncharacterised protein [Mycobacterium tuberculosis]COY03255.1 Uncharacterised protein [Mycobacterium tuberculosis]